MLSFCAACLYRTEDLHAYEFQYILRTVFQVGYLKLCFPCKRMANNAEVFIANVQNIQTRLNSLSKVTETDLENVAQCLHPIDNNHVKAELEASQMNRDGHSLEREAEYPEIKLEQPMHHQTLSIPCIFGHSQSIDTEIKIKRLENNDPLQEKSSLESSEEYKDNILFKMSKITVKNDGSVHPGSAEIIGPSKKKVNIRKTSRSHMNEDINVKSEAKSRSPKKRKSSIKHTASIQKIDWTKRRKTFSDKANMLKVYRRLYLSWPKEENWSNGDCARKAATQCGVSAKLVMSLIKVCNLQSTLTRPDETQTNESDVTSTDLKDDDFYQYNCPNCTIVFPKLEELITHVYTLHRRVECDYCGKILLTKGYLEKHIRSVHALEASVLPVEKKFLCTICDRPFAAKMYAKKHMELVHSNERKYYCVECDSYFKTELNLQNHLRLSKAHGNKLPFSCTICGKGCNSNYRLQAHMNAIHLNHRPYKCNICEKSYAQRKTLTRHIKDSHSGVPIPRNKLCTICGKKFTTKTTLRDHLRTHTGERPYKCPECPSTFTQSGARWTHIKLVHKNKKSIK